MRDAAAPVLLGASREQRVRSNEQTIERRSHACARAAPDRRHRSTDSRRSADNEDMGADKGRAPRYEPIAHALPNRALGIISPRSPPSLTDNFYQHALAAPPVEFSVEDLFPWAEIELAARNGDHHFTSHDLALDVRVRVVLTGVVVTIVLERLVWRELLQPDGIVMMQTGFVVVDEDRRGNMHRVDQHQPFLDIALIDALLHLPRDVDESDACRRVEPELFTINFHGNTPFSVHQSFAL